MIELLYLSPGLLKVVSTDYEQYALLYECGQEDDQGMCLQGHESVEVSAQMCHKNSLLLVHFFIFY